MSVAHLTVGWMQTFRCTAFVGVGEMNNLSICADAQHYIVGQTTFVLGRMLHNLTVGRMHWHTTCVGQMHNFCRSD